MNVCVDRPCVFFSMHPAPPARHSHNNPHTRHDTRPIDNKHALLCLRHGVSKNIITILLKVMDSLLNELCAFMIDKRFGKATIMKSEVVEIPCFAIFHPKFDSREEHGIKAYEY